MTRPTRSPEGLAADGWLARLLATDGVRRGVASLRWRGVFNSGEHQESPPLGAPRFGAPELPRPIGAWKPADRTGSWDFVRDDEWDRYMWLERRDRLPRHKPPGRFRVCLVGESAAAGMFYAPLLTPARLLETALRAEPPPGSRDAEVFDLSRNAQRLGGVIDVAVASSQLSPDALVIFAGNNVARDHTVGRPDASAESVARLRRAGVRTLSGIVEAFRVGLRDATVRAVEAVAKSVSCPVLWVAPWTSADWPRLAPCPRLGGARTRQWHGLLRQALAALRDGDGGRVCELGERMRRLDQGACPTAPTLIAAGKRLLGDAEQAACMAQDAVDADMVLRRPGFAAPGIQQVVRDAMIDTATRVGHRVVDLRAILARSGDDVFLDYCHLTDHGIEVVVGAVASVLCGRDRPGDGGVPGSADCDASALARARFDAAIYTSHLTWWPDVEEDAANLRHAIDAALAISPGAVDLIDQYVRMRHADVVTELAPSAHRIAETGNSLLDFGVLRWIETLDPVTIGVLCETLDARGRDGRAMLSAYLAPDLRRIATPTGLDVAHPRYLERFARDGLVDWDSERGTRRSMPTLRSLWPDLTLAFPARRSTRLRCRFTARLLGHGSRRDLRLLLNDREAAGVALLGKWSTHEIFLEDVVDGVNRLTFVWPSPADEADDADARAIEAYLERGSIDWFPVFGELFSCRLWEI